MEIFQSLKETAMALRTSLLKYFAAKAIRAVSRFAQTSPVVASSLLQGMPGPDQGRTMLP
jgi:hypothetical protein